MSQCIELRVGDCRIFLEELDEESIEVFISDPPYDLTGDNKKSGAKKKAAKKGFMNNSWDASGITFSVVFWELIYKKATPGAIVKFFGSPRTYHKMCRAMELGGFVDVQFGKNWIYGSGFPKNTNISKQIDKALGKVRAVVGTKKGIGGENLNDKVRGSKLVRDTSRKGAKGIGAYGTGAKQTSVDVPITAPESEEAKKYDGTGTALKPAWEPIIMARKPLTDSPSKKKPSVTEPSEEEKFYLEGRRFCGGPELSVDFLEPPITFSDPIPVEMEVGFLSPPRLKDELSELEDQLEGMDFSDTEDLPQVEAEALDELLTEFENEQTSEDELEMKLQEHVRKIARDIKFREGNQVGEFLENMFRECGEGSAAHYMSLHNILVPNLFEDPEKEELEEKKYELECEVENIKGETAEAEMISKEWEEKSEELESKCDNLRDEIRDLTNQVEELTEFKVQHESRDSR